MSWLGQEKLRVQRQRVNKYTSGAERCGTVSRASQPGFKSCAAISKLG